MNQTNKLLTSTLLDDKKTHNEHVSKLEFQLSEQASHNIKLQNDLTRITADCNHMQSQENLKNSNLNERIKHLEIDNNALKEANKRLDIKNSELQTAYMECESKMIKLQSDFQTLRKNCLVISDQAAENQKKYSKTVEMLNSNLAQYRNQILSLQQVNNTLSTHRNNLLDEIQSLRNKANASNAASLGQSFPLHYSSNPHLNSAKNNGNFGLSSKVVLFGATDYVSNPEMINHNGSHSTPYISTPSVEGEVLLGQYADSIRHLVSDINEGNGDNVN